MSANASHAKKTGNTEQCPLNPKSVKSKSIKLRVYCMLDWKWLRTTFILLSHLHLGLPSGLFLSGFN
jgi:hypothetical protein